MNKFNFVWNPRNGNGSFLSDNGANEFMVYMDELDEVNYRFKAANHCEGNLQKVVRLPFSKFVENLLLFQ
jgi:hypothetical protein